MTNQEYQKEYYKTHKDYHKEYYKTREDYYKEYHKKYYKESIANKSYLYMLVGDDRALYLGSTTNKYRLNQHVQGNSHLQLNIKDWVEFSLNSFCYADVSKITRDAQERCFLEKVYTTIYQPLLNDYIYPDIYDIDATDIDDSRTDYLLNKIYDDSINWQERTIALSDDDKAIYTTLILD